MTDDAKPAPEGSLLSVERIGEIDAVLRARGKERRAEVLASFQVSEDAYTEGKASATQSIQAQEALGGGELVVAYAKGYRRAKEAEAKRAAEARPSEGDLPATSVARLPAIAIPSYLAAPAIGSVPRFAGSDPLEGTVEARVLGSPREALPFGRNAIVPASNLTKHVVPAPRPAAPKPSAPADNLDATAEIDVQRLHAGAVPFNKPKQLTVNQYASLCAELARRPGDANVLATYQIGDPAALEELHADWTRRFAADASLRESWSELVASYEAWLART